MVMALRLPSWQAEGCRRTVLKVSIHDVCCATSGASIEDSRARNLIPRIGNRGWG